MTTYTESEIKSRQEAVNNAIANQRLEGLEPDVRTVADLMTEALGEITMEEVRARVFARIKAGEL